MNDGGRHGWLSFQILTMYESFGHLSHFLHEVKRKQILENKNVFLWGKSLLNSSWIASRNFASNLSKSIDLFLYDGNFGV